jgi:hypothetical protein
MTYETIAGEIKNTESQKTILRFLKIGDRFSSKSGKGVFEVWDEKCRFNGAAGSATRKCKNLKTGEMEHKLCRIEVIKL